MPTVTAALLKELLKRRNYKVYTDGRPNIIGVRSAILNGGNYDDRCYVFWNEGDKEFFHDYTITTDPGLRYLNQPIAGSKGTAILVEGQYVDCWMLGKHRQKQDALIQIAGAVKVYRDNNRDSKLDAVAGTIDTGYFGINLHHGSLDNAEQIGGWSAGCQVWRYADAHQKLIKKFRELSKTYKFDKFSYTLVKIEDLGV